MLKSFSKSIAVVEEMLDLGKILQENVFKRLGNFTNCLLFSLNNWLFLLILDGNGCHHLYGNYRKVKWKKRKLLPIDHR